MRCMLRLVMGVAWLLALFSTAPSAIDWTVETADGDANQQLGGHSSIAVDSAARPRIAYAINYSPFFFFRDGYGGAT